MYFINPDKKKCGVHALGLAAYEALKPLGLTYTEDLDSLPKGSLYIFNWHPGTGLGVLNRQWLENLGGKSIGFLHDPYNNPDFFDIKARLDPTFEDQHPFYGLPRIIKDYDFPEVIRHKIIVGSWGYGLSHKNYELIINKVENELEGAIIRFHIPFSDWCDANGQQAMEIARRCRNLVKKNKIEITHDYLETYDFLKWANENTINVFSCAENIVAGVSSCVDMALMAKRPIGVNRCMQFKHIYGDWTSLEDNSLLRIIEKWPTQDKYRECWTEENFRNKIKCLIEKIQP